MKTITDLQNDLSTQFGKLVDSLSPNELNMIMTFIMTTFANDFPEIKAQAYKYDAFANTIGTNYNSPQKKIYLEDLDEDFLELKICIPIKATNPMYSIIRNDQIVVDGMIPLEEVFSIQLASEYISDMEAYYTPKKPLILNDATGSYTTINKDCILFYSKERIVDVASIPEYIFSVLRPYSCFKFVDFVINRNFGDVMEMNKKIFTLMYGAIESDITAGEGLEGITSISLSGLSIAYNNKLLNYSQALNSLQNSFTNPAFIDEMNKTRDKFMSVFKRKKRVFYNYVL
jgi:hypothetical protein